MTTFVLVPGAWLGEWAWNKVKPLLVEEGHKVYPVTLTGIGEKVHLASKETGIETAIQDVLNIVSQNHLEDPVLVGHSFAGKVAAAAADRLSDKVGIFLSLDGYVPEKVPTPQGSFPDEFPVDDWTVPFPEKFLEFAGKDVQGADRDWMVSNASSLPVRYFRDPITLSADFDSVKKSYIFCTGGDTLAWYLSQSPGKSVDEVLKSKLDGHFRIIESGHWPMITKPRELTKALISLTST